MRAAGRRRAPFPSACALLLLWLPAAAAGGSPSAPKKIASRFHLLIQEAFPQAEIEDGGGKAAENSYRFQVFDERSGYARLAGPFQGYEDFFLIRGKGSDHLISVEYQCQPACTQRVTVQRSVAGAALEPVPMMDFLELPPFASIRRKFMSLCLDSEGNFDTLPDSRDKAHKALPRCPYVFSFPKKSSAPALLFMVVDESGGDLTLSVGRTRVSPRALLRWNGVKFAASELGGDEAIFLNGDKMRELF